MGVCNCSVICCTLLYVHSSIAIILMGKRELIALLNLSSWCLVMVERLFLAVPQGCLQFVIVVFPDHTHYFRIYFENLKHIYLNAKVPQLLLECFFLLVEPNILLYGIVINKSNDLPSKQHENQTSETYDCRSPTRNVRQPKFEKSQSYNTLQFIESQCYTTLHFIRKRCLTVICYQKQKGRQIKAGYFMHYVTFITSTLCL